MEECDFEECGFRGAVEGAEMRRVWIVWNACTTAGAPYANIRFVPGIHPSRSFSERRMLEVAVRH
jgi:hypothetical protein